MSWNYQEFIPSPVEVQNVNAWFSMKQMRYGTRYLISLISMVSRQQGRWEGLNTGTQFLLTELMKLPRAVGIRLARTTSPTYQHTPIPSGYSAEILGELAVRGIPLRPYVLDARAVEQHDVQAGYPSYYAGGPGWEGGVRQRKIREYFISLDLLGIRPTDVVVDIASEWSIFPEVVRRLFGATVYRQDLIYPAGVCGDRIGGNASAMPVADHFADKLVLHNAFEHFEGDTDTLFIREAWRVLRPGGTLCIIPLYMAEKHTIVTDPLVNRDGIVWDDHSLIIEVPWHHVRFGRYYEPDTLESRILHPARAVGFRVTLFHIQNTTKEPRLALTLQKPE